MWPQDSTITPSGYGFCKPVIHYMEIFFFYLKILINATFTDVWYPSTKSSWSTWLHQLLSVFIMFWSLYFRSFTDQNSSHVWSKMLAPLNPLFSYWLNLAKGSNGRSVWHLVLYNIKQFGILCAVYHMSNHHWNSISMQNIQQIIIPPL